MQEGREELTSGNKDSEKSVLKEMAFVKEVHDELLSRFGMYRKSEWEPTSNNVVVLDDDKFEEMQLEMLKDNRDMRDDEKKEHVRKVLAYADFKKRSLYVRLSQAEGDDFKQTLGHEMLHLWFLRDRLIVGESDSYGVNETMIECLSMEGLDMYSIPKQQRSVHIDNGINNTILFKSVLDKMGEKGWEAMFKVCQSGYDGRIKKMMREEFVRGLQIDRVRQLNNRIPEKYGRSFWDRFKEAALVAYYAKQEADFLEKNQHFSLSLELIGEWAGVMDKVLPEMDVVE